MEPIQSAHPLPLSKQGAPLRRQKLLDTIGIAVLVSGMALAVCLPVIRWQVTAGPANATKVFFGQLSSGQIDAAYTAASTYFKQVGSADDLKKFLETYPYFTHVTHVTLSDRSVRNGTAKMKGVITTPEGEKPVLVELVKEDGQWKVSNFTKI